MKKSPRYFVFDIDGTISQNGLPVSDDICRQIARLAHAHQVIFASARPIRDMLPMLPVALPPSVIFIGCNGGMAYQNGDFLFVNTLPHENAHQVVAFLKKHQLPYVLDGKWGYSLSKTYHAFHDYIDTLSRAKMEENALIEEGVTKILVLSNSKKTELFSLMEPALSIHQHKQENIFDITPANNNKHATLQKLFGHQPYMAFGNDQNDFFMLDNAETAIFLGEKEDYSNADFYLKTTEIAAFFRDYE